MAIAIQPGAASDDLDDAEVCYAPAFGSAKDPVNYAGMVAAEILPGDLPISRWDGGREWGFCSIASLASSTGTSRTPRTGMKPGPDLHTFELEIH
ncbi:hypothetical protein [uncultured Thiodictyon sp.]|jgi:hypothetical protein|uniref:hypothetical protein n=1 Tax=uncultured Thiodictyon sp. TaxID=1846217 RepID=UPI0025FA8D21|nr:hypothetical protein [uncultured Thiodictyon sp.]